MTRESEPHRSDRLSRRQLEALRRLRAECQYEDHHKGGTENFVLRGQLSSGIGEKTLADLKSMGLIEEGPVRWCAAKGYRITAAGLRTIE